MNASQSLTDHDWRRLARNVQTGNCVLVLGPEVAIDPDAEDPTPLTTLLARSLSEELGPNERIVNPDDLRRVAQLFERRRDRIDLELAVTDFYSRYAEKTTSLHRELAELPFTLCVTTTPDAFLSTAFQQAGKMPSVQCHHFRKKRAAPPPNLDSRCPVVFGLYGDISDPTSLVLTENDLLEFLVNVIAKAPGLPSFLTAKVSDPNVSFLFLGFGFHEWYVRILLHVLQTQGHRARSLALETPGFFEHPEQEEMAVFFEREHLIGFRMLSWEAFVADLKAHHDALVGQGSPSQPPPPAEAPVLFLCHSHHDKKAVAELGESLEGLGLRVWLDRTNLRGGDEWDRLIPEVLEKVDYVVVVQSPRMQQLVESYVYKEVRIALERQQRFGSGFRFIVPVNLEPCEGLRDLKGLHFIDLSSAQGINALADAVVDDWKRRQGVPEVQSS